MLTIEIICAGKLKEPYWQQAGSEYQKRLTPLCKLKIIEQPEGKPLNFPDDRAYTIALCIEGQAQSSTKFAETIWQLADSGQSKIRFLIGGSDGLFDSDKCRADLRLSLSAMTLPHHMARIFLLEQIYRTYMIREGRKYHK